jgi:hypothetical protein
MPAMPSTHRSHLQRPRQNAPRVSLTCAAGRGRGRVAEQGLDGGGVSGASHCVVTAFDART